jgi:hypothetical protein
MARIIHDGCGGEVHALYIRVNGAKGRRTWVRFGYACVRCHDLSPRRDASGAAYALDDLKAMAKERLDASHSPARTVTPAPEAVGARTAAENRLG